MDKADYTRTAVDREAVRRDQEGAVGRLPHRPTPRRRSPQLKAAGVDVNGTGWKPATVNGDRRRQVVTGRSLSGGRGDAAPDLTLAVERKEKPCPC